ncbi:MAG: adenosylcobinamide-GDP ribazoletransferase [Candidatus Nanopelagicales bacterium]
MRPGLLPDPVRLTLGTFTVLRVPPPRRLDTRVAGVAMLLAPAVGLLLGAIAAGTLFLVRWIGTHPNPLNADSEYGTLSDTRDLMTKVLASVLAVALLAWLTRALHLDGLADTADALGVKASGEATDTTRRRLAVMRQSDIGPFGVVTVVLVLLVQVAALLSCVDVGYGTVALITAVVTGRLAVVWACTSGVPAARTDGLAATVARTVPIGAAAGLTLAVMAGAYAIGTLDSETNVRVCVVLSLSVLAGVAFAGAVLRRCVRAFGGITGDVLGATVELATATVLVVVALLG